MPITFWYSGDMSRLFLISEIIENIVWWDIHGLANEVDIQVVPK